MYDWQFFGTFDLARISLWLFWLFFAGLVIYLQRENQREGYPLENDDGSPSTSVWSTPEPKTFILPHGRGTYQAPDGQREQRELKLARTAPNGGFPFAPTGDPMADGVGPAAWAMRRDEPELDGHGKPKLQPMAAAGEFAVAAGRDPRGLPVKANDRASPGKVSDMWVDVPEQLVRYLEITLEDGTKRLFPMTMAKIKADGVHVAALSAGSFKGIPQLRDPAVLTKLEEEKISAYVAGGTLYDQDKKASKMKALGGIFG